MSIAHRFTGAAHAVRNSSILIATQFTSVLIRLCYLYLLVRYLVPAKYGLLTYAMYWYLVLLPFTYLGSDVVLGREIGRNRAAAPALLGTTLYLRVLACAVATVLATGLAMLIEADAYVRSVIIIFSFSLIGRSLWMWSAAVFTAFEEVRPILKIEIVCRALEIVILIILLETAASGLRTIAAIHASSWMIQGLAAVALISRRWSIEYRFSLGKWLPVLRAGLPGAAFAIATALFFQLPLVLFRHIHGTGNSLGYFALAFQTITYLMAIPYLIASASLPLLSRSASRQDGKDLLAALLLMAAILFGGIGLVIVASFVVGPAVTWLFGASYAQTSVILESGLWLLIPASIAMLLQHLLFSNGVSSLLAALGPLIGVVAMTMLLPELTRASADRGVLLSIAAGLTVWACLAGLETARFVFLRRRFRLNPSPESLDGPVANL